MISLRHAAFKALALPTTSVFTSGARLAPSVAPLQNQPSAAFFGRRWNSNYGDQSWSQSYGNERSEAAPRAQSEGNRPRVRFGASNMRQTSAPRRTATNTRPPPEPSSTIYIGNLFFDVTEEQLKSHLEQFGQVQAVRVIFDGRGQSKGFGYAQFDSLESARRAVESMHMSVFEGRRLAVNYAHSPEIITNPEAGGRPRNNASANNEPTSTLFVGNLPYDITDRDLNDLFNDITGLRDVRVSIDKRTGMPRGFAHADFNDIESATKAHAALQDQVMYGRTLRVDYTVNAQDFRKNLRDSERPANDAAQF